MYRFKPTTLIAAIDLYRGISKNGEIPWRFKDDMLNFKEITTGNGNNAVIMGRKTWESIPDRYRGLSNRYNVILSKTLSENDIRRNNFTKTPFQLSRSFEDAMKFCTENNSIENIFICGGAEIYKTALDRGFVDEFHLTRIGKHYDCDKFLHMNISRGSFNNKYKFYDGIEVAIERSWPLYPTLNERQYLNLLEDIIRMDKVGRKTRNAATYSIFGPQLEIDLKEKFPLLTTKYMYWRGIVEELLFFLRGETNSRILSERGIHIWEPNTSREFLDSRRLQDYEVGDMGPMYGWNWRHFGANYRGCQHDYTGDGYDQLRDLLIQLKFNPTSRRMMLTTYDPSKVSQSVLAPCHGLITQFYVQNGILNCTTYQRSADAFLGLPFNIASYALLVNILCHVTGYRPGKLTISFGDCHIYKDHLSLVKEQISRPQLLAPELSIRKPFISEIELSNKFNLIPNFRVCSADESEEYQALWVESAIKYIKDLKFDDFDLQDYRYHPAIKAPMLP